MIRHKTVIRLCLGMTLFLNIACSQAEIFRPLKGERDFYTPQNWKQNETDYYNPAQSKPSNEQNDNKVSTNIPGSNAPIQNNNGADKYVMIGEASWYGPNFHGKKTANGETFNQYEMTAAHKYLPLNSLVRVTNLENSKTVIIRINDRGPYVGDRILDSSYAVAKALGYLEKGVTKVKLEVVQYPNNYSPEMGLEAYKQKVIQLAVFSKKDNAKQYMRSLQNRYSKIDFMVDEPRGGSYHVVAGPYDDDQKVESIAESIQKDGLKAFVRSYRK